MKIGLLVTNMVLLCFLTSLRTYAQDFEPGKGKVVIYFESNTKVIVRLDSTLLMQAKAPFSLKAGKYVVRAWAPTKQLFVDTIHVLPNRTTLVARRLKNCAAYTKYKEDVVVYKFKKTVTAFLPFPLTLGYSVFMVNQFNENRKVMNQHLANAKAAAIYYGAATSGADIARYTQEYNIEKDSYETCRTRNNKIVKTGAVFISTALAASATLFYFSKKVIRPAAYTESPLLSLNNILVRSDYPSTCSLGVIWNINR